MYQQLEGIEDLKGTYPFDLHRSYRARRLNRFLNNLKYPEYRERPKNEQLSADFHLVARQDPKPDAPQKGRSECR